MTVLRRLLLAGVVALTLGAAAPLPDRKPEPPAPPQPPAACSAALDALGVRYRALPALPGGPPCGTDHPLEVTGLGAGVALSPPATLTCAMARTLAEWRRDVLVPAAREHLGRTPTGLRVAASYVCRRVNGAPRAQYSQHAFANAIDISAVHLEDGKTIRIKFRGHPKLPPRTPTAAFQHDLRREACGRFTTVLGPGGDAFHGDHFHFDLKRRRGRPICD